MGVIDSTQLSELTGLRGPYLREACLACGVAPTRKGKTRAASNEEAARLVLAARLMEHGLKKRHAFELARRVTFQDWGEVITADSPTWLLASRGAGRRWEHQILADAELQGLFMNGTAPADATAVCLTSVVRGVLTLAIADARVLA